MKNKRVLVSLTAYWGNDDASSTIKISRLQWANIHLGMKYETHASSFYEGKRYGVTWIFDDYSFTIIGEDGMECVVEKPLSELIIEVIQ